MLTGKQILLVESDPLLLKFVRSLLEKAGLRVLATNNAESAIQLAQGFGGTIDLLLTGASLPRLSGAQLAQKLERRPGLQIMLMSSDHDAFMLASNHGWYFIQKPFHPTALLGEISAVLGSDKPSAGAEG
jgi:DNA-binding response OmpR family regulator